jgi:hypothetical protein
METKLGFDITTETSETLDNDFKTETNKILHTDLMMESGTTFDTDSIVLETETGDETKTKIRADVDSGKAIEVKRLTHYGTHPERKILRDTWLRLKPPAKRDTHPILYRRKMICKRIEQITRTDHNTYKVLIQRDVEDFEYVTLDCRTILNIAPNEEDPGTITFLFEQYFTDEEQSELHEIYLRGKFDDLGDMPEF